MVVIVCRGVELIAQVVQEVVPMDAPAVLQDVRAIVVVDVRPLHQVVQDVLEVVQHPVVDVEAVVRVDVPVVAIIVLQVALLVQAIA